ncbi:glutathione-disulfide reductase [Marivibrio halodurans]|uniref:Glutathione reductase n=1 Tax=Marivibrio halodurans TaxID=2039722 RepID=A0A8J7V1B9_9PROT|nr:glutathione-disulfide reductase [Marivibrio halodurans]MBP5857626.1 glutathione-disulfide reductase [Marivibrio halodurans]
MAERETQYDYDLFVIGAGSGGVRAARMASTNGAKVAIAEERHLGGTCVNIGCVPKKLFTYAAHVEEEIEDAAGYGWTVGERSFDWPTLRDNKTKEIERLNGIYGKLLSNAGVTLYESRAVLRDAHTVDVGGEAVTAERILIAVGGHPNRPSEPGAEYGVVSDDMFYLDTLPRRAVVVGGGYIAVEFAGILNGLGVETVQLYRGELFMRGFDDEVRGHLAGEIRKKGIDLRFKTEVEKTEKQADGSLLLHLSDGSTLETDLVLYAIGRSPKVEGLGLEAAGVKTKPNGAIVVDADYRTNVPSIYAIGDVTDRIQLTPVALGEGMVFAYNTYNGESRKMDYRDVPSAVFSAPPIGTVGLTEAEAVAQYGEIDVYRAEFRPMKHTLSGNEERALMKLLVDVASNRVVGLHMVGPDAGEIAQGFAVAFRAGATKADFDATVGIHPTSAEEFVTMREAARRVTREQASAAAE